MGHPVLKIDESIKGWMSHNELLWLAEQASKFSTILEIGSYCGRSTKALADNTEGRVYCIDPWDGPYYKNDGSVLFHLDGDVYKSFEENLREHIWSGKVIPFRGTFERFWGWVPADFIFIDGDHRYESVLH